LDVNQAYKLIFDSSPVAGILTDTSGKILLANAKAGQLFGYGCENLAGNPLTMIIPVISQQQNSESTAVRKDKTEFPAKIKAVYFESEGTTLIFRAISDISDTKKLITDLRERVKEQLTVLRITEALFKADDPECIFTESLTFIRDGWQYPEYTQVRIKLGDNTEYKTANFRETPWRLKSIIHLNGKPYGSVEVYYTVAFPLYDGTPFLKEEINLIDTLAKLFSIFLHQWHTVKKLQESEALITKVTALSPVNTYQFELDEKGGIHFLFASRGISFSKIDFSAQEILDDPEKLLAHIHPEDRKRFDSAMKYAHDNLTDINVQYRVLIGPIETWRWLRATSEKADNGKMIWYGSTQDITKIIEYINVLEEILFDISHVMRRPVSTMLGLTDYLITHENMDENTLKEFAKHLQDVASEMDDYIKKLNDAYHEKRTSITTANEATFSQLASISKKFKGKS